MTSAQKDQVLLLLVYAQKVKGSCTDTNPEDILVLPFDLLGSSSSLEQAAADADAAFGGAGIDFLIHNAGWYEVGTLDCRHAQTAHNGALRARQTDAPSHLKDAHVEDD
jgi:NAD(P)-dependent dehydrogenase (short-subunit alcohol dehydrogenase family)